MDPDEPTFHEELLFEANLHEFANRVGFICGLEAGGRISKAEAYGRIRSLWKEWKRSRKNLQIGEAEPADDE